MKKSLLTVSLFVLLGSTFCMYGQKNKKKSSNNQNNIELKSSTDSLSYAYGVGSAQQGLTVYLAQLGVLADTATIAADYRQKINIAANQVEKEKLEQKLQIALDSANNANNKNIDEFLQGVYARINDTTHSNAYSTGLDLGSQIKKIAENFSTQTLGNTEQIDLQIMVQGLANVLQNKPLLVPNSTELVEAKIKQGQSREAAKKEEQNARVIAAGKAFMEENAKRPGVVSLPSGLQYTIEKEGAGAIPQINDKVKVHYTGRLVNGTVFDSSVDRGEPITFGLQQVIPGWTEILQLMPVGSKWTVYIPYDLAYGDRETGSIKPYSNLIFDIELLDIEK